MRVLLTTTGDNRLVPYSGDELVRLQDFARGDRFRVHQLVDDPVSADLILFVGSRERDLSDVRSHPWVKRFREKTFHYCLADNPFPFLPGVFPSMRPSHDWLGRAVGGPYTAVLHTGLKEEPFDEECPYLFSFIGSTMNHPVRKHLAALGRHPRGKVIDTSGIPQPHAPGRHREQYRETMKRSKFVLCPVGRGPSSWRIFEALRVGRVPVVIADEWVPPVVDREWETFSLRVPEAKVDEIPDRLARLEGRAGEMASLASTVFMEWFAADVVFHRIVESCVKIFRARRVSEGVAGRLVSLGLLTPRNLRLFALPTVRRMIEMGRPNRAGEGR